MSGACASGLGLTAAERLADYVECQSAQIDAAAFQGGLWHGLPAAFVSTLLALYVAGLGYRLLLGRGLDVADLVYSAFRVGLAVTVMTSWSAYSTLVWTVSSQGPAELTQMAAAPAGLDILSPTVTAGRVEAALQSMETAQGAAALTTAPQTAPPTGAPATTAPGAGAAPSGTEPDLNVGGAVLMFSEIGFGLAARLAQALVLAAGPLFIAAAMFDVSISLFIGWLRALAALFIAQAGYALVAAIELSFLESEVSRMTAGQGLGSSEPLYLGVVFCAAGFAITMVAAIASGALTRLASAKALPRGRRPAETHPTGPAMAPWRPAHTLTASSHSRAAEIADSIHHATMREEAPSRGRVADVGVGAPDRTRETGAAGMLAASPGSGLRRAGSARTSAGASRRDARA